MADQPQYSDPPPVAELQGPVRILVIEDNPGDACLIQDCFRPEDGSYPAELEIADTLHAALDALARSLPDFVFLDLSLPDSNGIGTFRTIQERAQNLPIVVLSGNENEELAAEIVRLGAQDSLSKDILGSPLSGTLIRRTVRHAIERQHAHESLKAMQMQLIQAEKLESLGRLAAGVAHEVRNPLANIRLGLERLHGRVDATDETLTPVLDRMSRAVERANKILDGMLAFAANRVLQRAPTPVEEMIENSLLLIGHELSRRKIEVRRQLCEEGTLVSVDARRIEQVLINLMTNASHAMEDEETRTLTIRTRRERIEGIDHNPGERSREHLRNGDEVSVISIEDTGGGIDKQHLAMIWDPFFTTKPAGSGTGLGLSVVRKIIDLHQGIVTLENADQGCRASIKLKIHQ